MITIKDLLAAVPATVRAAIDEDTLEYLTGVVEAADASDPTALRDAAEPFLTDAGMSDAELEAMFAKLSVTSDTGTVAVAAASKGPVLLPSTSRPQPLPAPVAAASAPARPATATAVATQKQQQQQQQGEPSKPARASRVEPPVVQAYSQQSRFHNETITTLSKDVDLKTVNVVIGESELLVDARLWLKAGQHYGM
ncbi:hypothetical protein GGF42_002632, partial [Coemansia sp. RSA 2424]